MTADTSVVVPALATWHEAHAESSAALRRVEVLIGHVLLEVYSVLTRLPRDRRLDSSAVARMLEHGRRPAPLVLPARALAALPGRLSDLGISGGTTYDALVGATAAHHGHVLLTRDTRAMRAYEALGAAYELVH